MAEKNISSNIIPLKEFIGNNKFKLLKSQREYKWSKDEIKQFFDDLIYDFRDYQSSEDKNKNFLIGCIYTTNDNGYLSIIDGQQRTVSTLIILKTLINLSNFNLMDEYKIYYKNKFTTDDSDRREQELKYYKSIFDEDESFDKITNYVDYSKIASNILELKAYLTSNSKTAIDENEYHDFIDFLLDKVLVIHVDFNDQTRLAFDTFIKLNARGIDLTDLEMLHSFVWTLNNVNIKDKEKFSDEYKECCNEFYSYESKNKKIETREKELEEAFSGAYKIYGPKLGFEYKPKSMFTSLSKYLSDEKNGQRNLRNIIDEWLFYTKKYIDLIIDYGTNLWCVRKYLKDSKREEYIPIIGYINIQDNYEYNEQIRYLCDLMLFVSYYSYLKFEYKKINEESVSKFDSKNLLFSKMYEIARGIFEESEIIDENRVRDYITTVFCKDLSKYYDEIVCFDYEDKKSINKVKDRFIKIYDKYF